MAQDSAGRSGVMVVGGFEFPSGPSGSNRRFASEGAKWRWVVETLREVRRNLSASDRGFYRDVVGLEAMARQNFRDRRAGELQDLEEPELAWLVNGSGR